MAGLLPLGDVSDGELAAGLTGQNFLEDNLWRERFVQHSADLFALDTRKAGGFGGCSRFAHVRDPDKSARVGVKAAEDSRTPRRFARTKAPCFREVLECGCPLPLSPASASKSTSGVRQF